MKAVVIWGTQLTLDHNSALRVASDAPVIMIESASICRSQRFHKQKIRFILSAMRDFADAVRDSGRTVHYSKLDTAEDRWFDELSKVCESLGVDHIVAMRQNDRRPQQRLESWCRTKGLRLETTPNELFLTSASEFESWAEDQKRLLMENFYRWQRKRLNILMDGANPEGGSWNYDADNRKPLPKGVKPPSVKPPTPSRHAADIDKLIVTHFSDHPGSLDINWIPTSRPSALTWLEQFLDDRFGDFGIYEDAMRKGETFLYHSGLSAMMNVGLLHPREIIDKALEANDIPLASREGFVRQIIGWREFMFGLYHHMPDDWRDSNYLQQNDVLPDWWWKLTGAPEPPLQDALARLDSYGYSHHIERLMIFGNYMLIAGYSPKQAYEWFMSMYVDAYDWVMVPNVIGMSQYADGGIHEGGFASKPYISGSNYLQKMGSWWPTAKAAKDSEWTEMYWNFLDRHENVLSNNHRLKPLYRHVHKRRGST